MTLLNIYGIENLNELKTKYRLYSVRGLSPQSEDFDKNAQMLSDRLSRTTKSPCAIVKEHGQLFLAQPVGYPNLPDRQPLVGTVALIEPTREERELDYGSLSEANLHLATRFLQFHLDGLLYRNRSLWQPSTGMPFFQKEPDRTFGAVDVIMYRGFRFRLITLPDNKIGVCVDVTRKYASPQYLPAKISENDFRRFKGRRCIYEYGHRWYEVTIEGITDLSVSEEMMPDGVSVFDHIHSKTKDPKPASVIRLPKDSSVITYQTSLGAVRRVPSALCRLTFATNQPQVSKYHSKTIMPPHQRRQEIEFVVRNYLRDWKFQGVPIVLSNQMLDLDCDVLKPPNLLFGNGRVLSHNGEGVPSVLHEFGQSRRQLLHATDAGFFVKKDLDRQYLIIPKSIYETFGLRFIDDMKKQFTRLYSPNGEFHYNPSIVTYDDSVRKSIYNLGREVLRAVTEFIGSNMLRSGYGLVIIPRLSPGRGDKEDELANLLMRELRKMDIYVSVSHTEVPSMSYVAVQNNGQTTWEITKDEWTLRKFRGYLENLVLNKILLLNGCWPFALSTPLNSDLIIGLDVKKNTAGFMFILKEGRTFVFKPTISDQKEQLSKAQVSSMILDYLRSELDGGQHHIRDVTIHRDGKLYPAEAKGIREALDKLAREGLIEKDYNCNFVEIKKTSRVPVRFFDTSTPQGTMREWIENPKIGKYRIFDNAAFVCTTGRPFRYNGTTKPLQIVKVEGHLDFKRILEDIFSLANLTWTKPDYCSRLPISVKMTDIRLREIAGEYDEDKLRFSEEEDEE